MTVLIIGGTGFISSRLALRLSGQGHTVSVLSRGKRAPAVSAVPGIRYLVGNRKDEAVLASAAREHFDAVYDMIAYFPEESAASVRAFRGSVGRFVHCSTVSVYMVSDAVRCPITEDQDNLPLMKFHDRNPFGMDYGIKKRECERILWDAHHERDFPVTILRPTYVSGPRDPVRRDWFWIERILDGKPLLVPGSGDIAFQQVYVEDVVNAFASVLDRPASIGNAYNVAGEEARSLNDYLDDLCSILGRQPERIHVDQRVFDQLPFSTCPGEHVFPFNTIWTAIFSLSKTREHLAYRSTPFRRWMGETIEYFTRQGTGHSAGYEQRPREVAFALSWKKLYSVLLGKAGSLSADPQ
jgi:nucleoside-diphosphate-sugar epimerase